MKIYAFDNKILALNNKWLKEADAPTGYVMNASNVAATYDEAGYVGTAVWQGPAYPDGYNGYGKTIVLTVTEYLNIRGWNLQYTTSTGQTPSSSLPAVFYSVTLDGVAAGTYTFNMQDNSWAQFGAGKYLTLTFGSSPDAGVLSDIISKFELTIIDP